MRRVAQLSFDDARRKAPIGPALTVLPDGACPRVASPEALALLFRDVCREETPREGPFWGIRDQPGFARAAQDLMAALAHGLVEPAELLRLPLAGPVRERVWPLAKLLAQARLALDRRGLTDPNRALR